jgi:signal transduction histidine kinase/ActR/RegA family two-component response regulator
MTTAEAAIAHCQDGIIVLDAHGRVVLCNPRAAALLALPSERDAREHWCATHLPPSDHAHNLTMADGNVVEIIESSADGQRVLTCRDVTHARRTALALAACEAKFGALEDKFNEVIGTVMSEVHERQSYAQALAEAKAAAEAATEAKSAFLASMSHEVRTPLNGILGYTDMLLSEQALDASSQQITGKIRSAGHALLSVVNDILDFSEIESGGLILNQQDFSVAGMVQSAIEIVEPLLIKKGLSLNLGMDPAIARFVHGDEGRIRQVLLNLLNNAVKFTSTGSITVAVTVSQSHPDRQTLTFVVSDTGIGIPADKHARLFERFSQVDTSIRRRFGGAGLGLAISKQLVTAMGGQIGCRSVEHEGSVFSFTIELLIADAPDVPVLMEAAPPLAPKHILLVEDVEMNREIAQAMITAAGYTVDVAPDGGSAIAAVQSTHYDLVLMDIQMPDMDGVTATQHIRELGFSTSRLPIIAMTAHVFPREVERFIEAGMNDHLGKPFRRDVLQSKIAEWCGDGRASAIS